MKKVYALTIMMLLLAFISATNGFTQVGLTATGGIPTGSYATLKAAFDAINNGTHTGIIAITITGTTTETASAALNASGGSASYTAVSIQPSGVAVISGAISGHLIDLNGADNVTIDGLNAGGNSLTISNTGTSSASTIRFFADATNNVVTNCSLQGSTIIFGVVYFGGGTVTGNDNNTISNCNIGPAGANLPLNGIYSFGTSTAIDNSGNTITNNNIFDYFNASLATSGMNINSNNSAWTITSNRLYQTANRTYSSAGTHNGINITTGSGYTITGNIIGYANSGGTGTTNMIGLTSGSLGGTFPSSYTVGGAANATKYVGINCAFTTGGAMSSIQNNTIAGFALYTASSTSSTFGVFCGIGVSSGNVNIGTAAGNMIGTATSSIYTATTISAGAIAGIYVTSSNTVTIQNNILQNLDAMGATATTAGSINGINTEGAGGTVVVSGNTIGNTTNPNLRMGNLTTGTNLSNVGTTFGTASGTSLFQGIRNAQTGTVTIGTVNSPNIIRNVNLNSTGSLALYRGIYAAAGTTSVSYNTISSMTSPSGGTSYSGGGLAGIGILVVGCTNPVISYNTISGLSLTNAGTSGYTLAGIVYNTPVTSVTVSKNRIWGLSNASASVSVTAPGTATGIFIRDGGSANTTIDNNMISLGNGQSSNTAFIGIWSQYLTSAATTLKIYYNSVNIEGTVTAGAQPSMCLQRGDFSTTASTLFTIDARDNIFINTRTGGTGKHYTLANNYGAAISSSTGWGANASNYNVLNGNAATIGYWSGDQPFAAWQTASACDGNSLTAITVNFLSAPTADLHLNMGSSPTKLESGSVVIPAVTSDIDGDSRPGPVPSYRGGGTAPDFGADEFDGVPFNIPALFLSGIKTDVSCNGMANGSISTMVTGGTSPYTYLWSNGATTSNLGGLAAGSYTVTVSDVTLANVVGSWTVSEPAALSLSGSAINVSCAFNCDGAINISAAGGTTPYTYAWSDLETTQNISALCPGGYTVTVTDAHQCVITGNWTVGEPGEVSWQASVTNETCSGGNTGAITTLFTIGGTPPYTYYWNNGATTPDISGLTAGTYHITVTDAHGCDARSQRTVSQPDAIGLAATVGAATCPTAGNGTIDLTVTGGTPVYTYAWSNSATTEDLGSLAPATYTITVTDANGCQVTGNWSVGVTDPVCDNLSVTGTISMTVCYNAHNTITVAGGTSTFVVSAPGGNATFIAGQNILFEPGTHVEYGAYMNGYISQNFCTNPSAPVTAAATGKDEPQLNLSRESFTLYPNPTSGNFTLVQKGEKANGSVKEEVYSMTGEKVMTEQMIGEKSHEFHFSNIPVGLYFVKVVAGDYVETIKLVKTR